MRPPDVEVGHERPPEGRATPCDMDVPGVLVEMPSCARRSAGPRRRLILVARSFEDTRRPLDIKAGDERPRKDRRLRPCDSDVTGAKEEMPSCDWRIADS